MRQLNLKLNPKKCFFGVSSGKLLGYIISIREIEIDPKKGKAIMDMPPPRNINQLRSSKGRLQLVERFIEYDKSFFLVSQERKQICLD